MKYLGSGTAATDLATIDYVNTDWRGSFFQPPSGGFIDPSHLVTASAGTPPTQACYWMPFDIGPTSFSMQALAVQCTTALTAGSGSIRIFGGIYADDDTGGGPLLTAPGLLGSGDIAAAGTTTFTTGTKTVSVSLTLTRGRYWAAFLLVTTGTVTTVPAFNCIGNCISLWKNSSGQPGAICRALLVSSLSALPTTTQTLVNSAASTIPVVALKAT